MLIYSNRALDLMDDTELWTYLTRPKDFVNIHNFRYITLERIIKGIIMLFRHDLHRFRSKDLNINTLFNCRITFNLRK